MQTLEAHELTKILPEMTAEELTALKDDIEQNGLQQPIILHEGKILDGRHRYRACQELEKEGVKVSHPNGETTKYNGKDARAFVISTNLSRRHPLKRAA